MNKILVTFALISFFNSVCALDVITTRDGSVYKGALIEQDTVAVAIELQNGSVFRIPNADILSIRRGLEERVKSQWIHTHDGFFLSLNMGLGGSRMDFEGSSIDSSGSMTLSGAGLGLDVRIGGALRENLILSFDMWANGPLDPGIRIGGMQWFPLDSLDVVGIGTGAGITYYFMPANMFIAGSVGMGAFTLTYDEGFGVVNHESALGYSLMMKCGKEWWVSPNWGLGVSANYALTSAADAPDLYDSSYRGKFLAHDFVLKFNATFN